MKIAIDIRPLMSGKISGVEVYILSMLEAIFEADQENEYIVWYNAYHPIDTSTFPIHYPNVKLVHTRIPSRLYNLLISFLRWPKIDKLIGEKVDVLWVTDPRPAPVSKACKKVTTFHDLSFEDFKHSFSFKTRLWHKILRPKKEALESDKIIAVSQFTKHQLVQEYGVSEDKIEVILEAASPKLKPLDLPKGFELIQRKYNIPNEYFLCLSTLEPRKNTVGVIETYIEWQRETNAEVNLVVAGKRYPEIFSSLKLTTHPKIFFPGFIDEEDKALLYQHCQGFFFPSFYEGFGLPILEAMQCGAPVVTSDATSMPEVAGDAAILINPNESGELKKAMHDIHRDEVLRHMLIEKGLKQAAKFSWGKAASEFLSLIKHM